MQSEDMPKGSYEPLHIREEIGDMIKWAWPVTKQFPRRDRNLADEMRNCMLRMYKLSVEIEKKYIRKTTCRELDVELEWMRLMVRMASDKDFAGAKFAPPLSMSQYETWAKFNKTIGDLLGGYIKSLNA